MDIPAHHSLTRKKGQIFHPLSLSFRIRGNTSLIELLLSLLRLKEILHLRLLQWFLKPVLQKILNKY